MLSWTTCTGPCNPGCKGMADRRFSLGFWAFWLGHTASLLGDVLFSAGMMWFVYQATGSALATSGVPLAEGAARLLLGLVAGPMADRRARSRWMVELHLVKMALVLVTATLLTQQALAPWGVYSLAFGLMGMNALYEAVQGALLPELVAPSALARANAFLQVSRALGYGVSWALSGLSLSRFGPLPVAWANVATFLVATLVFAGVHAMGHGRRAATPPTWTWNTVLQDLALGWSWFRRKAVLHALLSVSVPGWLLFGLWGPLQLVFLDRVLATGPQGWGWSQASFFLSGLVGALAATRILAYMRWAEGVWVLGVTGFHALLTVGFGLAPTFGWALVTVVLAGVTDPVLQAARLALLQKAVPDQVRGRVLGVWNLLMASLVLFSFALAGWLGEWVPLRALYAFSGLGYLTVVVATGLLTDLARVRLADQG